jgi:hypothetical protein
MGKKKKPIVVTPKLMEKSVENFDSSIFKSLAGHGFIDELKEAFKSDSIKKSLFDSGLLLRINKKTGLLIDGFFLIQGGIENGLIEKKQGDKFICEERHYYFSKSKEYFQKAFGIELDFDSLLVDPFNCPRDGSKTTYELHGLYLDIQQCISCQGALILRKSFQIVRKLLGRNYKAELQAIPEYVKKASKESLGIITTPLICPHCRKPMEIRGYPISPGLGFFVCPENKYLWIDRQVIDALERYFQETGQEINEIWNAFWASLDKLFSYERS